MASRIQTSERAVGVLGDFDSARGLAPDGARGLAPDAGAPEPAFLAAPHSSPVIDALSADSLRRPAAPHSPPAREPMREGDKQSHLISVLAPGRPAPRRIRGFIGAGLTARINLGWDLAALMTLVVFGQRLLGNGDLQPALGPLTQMALLAASVWIVVATAVHYYANSAYQSEPLDDAAMTAVVLVSVFTSLEMASLVSRSTGLMSGSLRVLVLDFAIALAVRPIFRSLSRREIPSSNVLVVGAGIRGRLVAESIERANRETVLGAVAFENERPDSQGLPVLAPFDRLETVLRSTAVNKVYIAGNALKDGPAMQRAINVCEQLGVPFALPAYSFRMGRASPQHGQYLAHGYVHYTLHEPQLRMRAMKRLFDIASSAAALWLLAPLFIAVTVASGSPRAGRRSSARSGWG